MTLYIIAAALLIMSASLGGIIFVNRQLGHLLEGNLRIFIAFSAGIFAVLVYSLFRESLDLGLSPALFALAVAGGMLFLEGATRLIPHAHHHHEEHQGHGHSRTDSRRMLLGDAVHNIGDGIILVPAFLADVRVGVATALAVFLHEFVQEVAEFFVLRAGGYSTRRALLFNALVSSSIFIGIGASLAVSSIEELQAPLMAFAGGGFLYVILRDLLPSITRGVRERGAALPFALSALLGVALMTTLVVLTPHEHVDDDHDDEHTAVELLEHEGDADDHDDEQ